MFTAVLHYILPRQSNDHKAKLLHLSTLILLVGLIVFYQFMLVSVPISGARILGYAANISTEEIIELTNEKRLEKGTGTLRLNSLLSAAAQMKGEDMLSKGYWSHVSPDGIQPWKFFLDQGYKYRYAGENLARDFSNPRAVVDAWMASPSHKENLLSAKYEEIGVAVVEGDLNGVDTTLVIQLFGTRQDSDQLGIPIAAAASNDSIEDAASINLPDDQIETNAQTDTETGPNSEITEHETNVEPVSISSIQEDRFLISPFVATRGISIAIVGSLMMVMVADIVMISQNKIPRRGSKIAAHLVFLGMVFTIVLIAKAGRIL